MAVTAQCGFCRRVTDAQSETGSDSPLKVAYCTECNTWYQRLITYGQGTPLDADWGLEEPPAPEGKPRSTQV